MTLFRYIGENDHAMRAGVCQDLDYLNIILHNEKDILYTSGLAAINTDNSRVKILVVPTNEEYEIAHQCFGMLNSVQT